jgi:hypothetical protein
MATLSHPRTTPRPRFAVETSRTAPGYNLPQQLGRVLWLPMLLMAIAAFAAGMILAGVRADGVAAGASPERLAALQHVVAGLMFLGFAAVFAAISFAIARILGELRRGGGRVQEAARRSVRSLAMPLTAKLFIALMALAMMTLLGAVALHFVFAASVGGSAESLVLAEQRFVVLEGVRRLGVALYLAAIAFGLAAIVHVLRFQAIRLRELPTESPAD